MASPRVAAAPGPPDRRAAGELSAPVDGARIADEGAPPSVAGRDRPGPRLSLAWYVRAWVAGGAGAAAALFLGFGDEGVVGAAQPYEVLLLLGLTVLAEAVELRLHHGRAEEVITLLEAAVVLNVLLLPPVGALVATLGGLGVAQLARRREPIRIAFNLGQFSLATSLVVVAAALTGDAADPVAVPALFGITAGIALFGVTNTLALSGVVSRLDGRPLRDVVLEDARLSALNVFGNATVGIIAAVLWRLRPELVLLLAVPAAILHLAYRGVVRSEQLLGRVAAERDRLDRVVAGASDGIALLDRDGHVEVWSPAMESLTGVSPEAAAGRLVSEVLVGRDHVDQPADPLAPLRVPDPARPVHVEELTLSRRGEQHIVLTRHTLLFDDQGQATGDVLLLHDVTRQREVEAMKDDFVARVSHELRTPLTPIKGYASNLARRGDQLSPEQRTHALHAIASEADQMSALIEDLLLVSQISAPRATVDARPQALDLHEVCSRVLASFESTHAHRRFDLVREGDVPPALGDAPRVERILSNLLSNACKFSDDDQPVTVAVRRSEDTVAVSVVDRGHGIPEAQLERVFDRFHRVENPLTMTTGGLGLGLYISRQFAVSMGGDLTAASTPGSGSTFTLQLPVAEPEQ